jgi:apolipoprotein N-acyltransferase
MNVGSVIARIAAFFILSWGWKRSASAFIAGAVSALAMPPFDAFPVLFATFPVLVWLLDGIAAEPSRSRLARLRHAFMPGWWFGFGYFLAGLWWIGHAFLVEAETFAWAMPFAVVLLPATLAVFWGLATAFARMFWSDGPGRVAALAAGIALAEYLRGHLFTGFPWNVVGEAAMTFPLTMQKASLLGLYGVTALAAFVFCLPALAADRKRPANRLLALLALVVVGADIAFGAWRLAANPTSFVDGASIRLVQPAIDQAEKWSPDMEARNFSLLMELSVKATSPQKQGLSGTSLLVWPETAFPFVLTDRRDALAAISAMLPEGTILAAGAVRIEPPAAGNPRERAFNSVYAIGPDGSILGAADKVHLVPFGEYLPFQETAEAIGIEQLTRLRGGFERGSGRVLLDGGATGSFLPLICYEIIFPGEALEGVPRPDFILNLTNDAWFGMTPGPYQHWRQAVLRGVEEGLPVVRSANNGISSVTDANGRVVEGLALGERGVVDSLLPAALLPTIYATYGNSSFFGLLGLLLALAVFMRKTN